MLRFLRGYIRRSPRVVTRVTSTFQVPSKLCLRVLMGAQGIAQREKINVFSLQASLCLSAACMTFTIFFADSVVMSSKGPVVAGQSRWARRQAVPPAGADRAVLEHHQEVEGTRQASALRNIVCGVVGGSYSCGDVHTYTCVLLCLDRNAEVASDHACPMPPPRAWFLMCVCMYSRFRAPTWTMQGDIARKDRLVTVAMSARAEAQSAYQQMKQGNEDLERRFRETQV